ncbi:SUKH-3 domain-containing protein [Streptomyces sp. NPDC051639]|uniref:SUKH-3 domain-containing protein n=1 Tax=unclassified Streptomyces TaxID=2593676 RepID=UPI0033A0A2E6
MSLTPSGHGRLLVEHAGWTVRREVDVMGQIRSLESVGFPCSQYASEFLRGFSGLKIEHLPSISIDGREIFTWTEFDPSRVCTERDAWISEKCSEVALESLFPVGVDGFHLTIYTSPRGRFFAGVDSFVYLYSETIDGLFDKMANGIRPHRIGVWELDS